MTKEEILKVISEIHVAKFQLKKYLKNHYEKTYNDLVEKTKFLGTADDISVIERIYCLEHDIESIPKCQVCKEKEVKFDANKVEYKKWCSISCSCKDHATLAKTKKTRLEKYGSETYSGADKAKKTRYEKNNGHWHNENFLKKLKQTKLEKYGDENFVNRDKAKKTKLEKYGDENFVNRDKAKKTKLEKYGDENWNNRNKFKNTLSTFSNEKKEDIVEKRKQTCIQKYGTQHAIQSESVKAKSKNTCLERYGVETPAQIRKVKEASIHSIKEKSWKHIIADKNYIPMFNEEEYVSNKDQHKKWKWKCMKCNDIFEAEYDNGHHHRCYKCWPNLTSGTSLLEQQIRDYIKTLTDERVYNKEPENKRIIKNREIDIYIPTLNLGIEVDGLYYHSEDNGKGMTYHLHKTEECEKHGIKLIHIFEDEWTDKQDIVKSRLKHMICNNEKKLFARKCKIEEISDDEKNSFLDRYHIQGKDISKVRYGLKYDNELVAVMTFIKSRFDKKFDWELSRYATTSDCTVVGGASKLLKHFEKTYSPKSLLTYADRRWSNGNMYFKLGFSLARKSKPNYFYVKHACRYSRIAYQKHKLSKLLDNYNEKLSEVQNMKNNGYSRIFDCGNLVFHKTY